VRSSLSPVDGRSLATSPGLDTTSPRREIGSWVIASAAFMLIAFRQSYVLPYVPLGLSPARFILFIAAGLFILTRLAGQHSRYRLGVLGPVLAIYFLCTLVAYGTGMRPSTPVARADYYFVREILLISVVLFCFTVIHGYVGLRRIIKGLVAGGVVSAVSAILALFTGVEVATKLRLPGLDDLGPLISNDLVRMEVVRPQGSADHPLELAAVLTVIFPLALGLTQCLRARGERWWLWAVATAIILAGIVVTVSRSAVIVVPVLVVVMAWHWPVRRTLGMLAVLIGVVIAGMTFNVPVFKAYSSIFGLGLQESSANDRQVAAENLISNHLSWFGMYGQYPPILDNQYLSRLAEAGLFGLLTYTMMVATALVLAFLAFRNARNRANTELPAGSAHLFLGLVASLTACALMSLILDVAGFTQVWTMMWLLIASSAVAFRISRAPDDQFARVATMPAQLV
jgi:O-antigen ligase